MIKLAILFAVGVIAQQAYCDEPERIIGGIAALGQFKYQVSLQSYGEHICGGTIISNTHILTAAHCVDDTSYIKNIVVVSGIVTLGVDGEKHDIKCIRIHPDYTGEKESGWKHDIAVITLEKPIKTNNIQGPIAIATKDYTNVSNRGLISGWGKTRVSGSGSENLMWRIVNVLSQEHCLNKNLRTNENQICTLETAGIGACQGDSGGPLVIDNEVCGVVSWVLPCALDISDVYTNVYRYRDFIRDSQLLLC